MVTVEKKNKKLNKTDIEHYPPELLYPTGLTDRMRTDFRLMRDLG